MMCWWKWKERIKSTKKRCKYKYNESKNIKRTFKSSSKEINNIVELIEWSQGKNKKVKKEKEKEDNRDKNIWQRKMKKEKEKKI